MINQTPFCDRNDCRVEGAGTGRMTTAYYAPVHDKEGVNLNPDRNTLTMNLRCLTCGKTWTQETIGQVSTVHNLKG